MLMPTPETAPQYPETPYGISKTVAERIHRVWLAADPKRKLVICRPSVIFGPGDKENIPRMLRAVRSRYFVFPGSPDIVKGYGYVYGLVESFHFMTGRAGRLAIYNYAERDCLSLRGMVGVMQEFFGKRALAIRIPMPLLVAAAYFFQVAGKITGKRYAIHPVRVRKVAFPTNLKPQVLMDLGFPFKYSLDQALRHWKSVAPGDF
jgi:nucleoside-diphosphate-sugar epimerase